MPDEPFRPRETASEREVTSPRRSTSRLAVQKALGQPVLLETGDTILPHPSFAQVIRPKLQTVRARMLRGEAAHGWRWTIVAAIGLLFWLFVLLLGVKVLYTLKNTPEIGSLIAGKLLSLAFISFFMILVLSNVIISLSTFFLSRDLDMLVSGPVDWLTLYAAKLSESMVNSSWMVTGMAIPIFGAYGYVYHAGWTFVFVALAVWIPFVIIPAVIGAATTNVLVNTFPARRTRDILSVVAVFSAAGIVLLFRLMRPEQLVRPEGVRSLVDFIALLRTPTSPYLPSEWGARAIMTWLDGGFDPLPFYLLWSTAAASLVLGAIVHWKIYPDGFSKAQESAQRWVRGSRFRSAMQSVLNPLGPLRRELVLKEVLSGNGITLFIVNVIPWGNLGLAGFVLASIAARFIFPAVSMEGRTLWLLKSSPLQIRQLLWAKFWTGTLPLLVIALAIVGVTDALLQVTEFIFVVSIFSITLLTFAVAGLALGLGTVFPQYETENAAQIPTSFGGLVFMIVSLLLVTSVVVLEAWPVVAYLRAKVLNLPLDMMSIYWGFGLATLLCLIATFVPLTIALRRLETTEL
jgi:ABC-2 type transport system permease protein